MIELLTNRRSIRKYLDKKVEKEKIADLKSAAVLAPSSRNLRPLEFVFTEDRETIEGLSLAKSHGSAFLKGAPLAAVVLADETKSDVWIEDAAIATIIIQLTAESLGLKSCWIQIRKRFRDEDTSSEEYIRDLLGIPERYRVLSMVAIGYPDESRAPYAEEELDFSVIRENKF